jgi:hypothetical protein
MALTVEIDRGDVYRDPVPRWHDVAHRPALIVHASSGDQRIPRVR